jgi:hypothetical protein
MKIKFRSEKKRMWQFIKLLEIPIKAAGKVTEREARERDPLEEYHLKRVFQRDGDSLIILKSRVFSD